jgi:peptidoglycan glycosyltransferase
MTKTTAQKLQDYMNNNVVLRYGEENFPGLTVCAKSGTAELGGDETSNAMFAGFVMDEDYPLAFFVAVEGGGYGRHTCVPIISEVLQSCVEVMDAE